MWFRCYAVSLLIFIPKIVAAFKPNIIFILADDLGWNDVGFHGSNQIPTPNIDALAYTGIILNNYYVTPICTPSRAALLTGKYPIHTGLQHGVVHGSAPYGLDLNEIILPEYLKSKGYSTKAVGKWHLGSFEKNYTPEYRGFDSHYGYWTGHQDYFDHTAVEKAYWGYDMRRGMNITWSDYGKYTTDLFTEEAVKIIENHDKSQPLFLYLAHLATHSANGYSPLQAPIETISKFDYISDKNRRIFAAMLSKLDDSVGSVVTALAKANILNNSIIIFSTDNGGPAAGFDLNAASNWPLRGVKDTLWEGGVRGAAFIWSSLLPSSKVSNAMMHITDWMPTLLSLVNAKNFPQNMDGVNVWNSLLHGTSSPRNEILLNIDTERNIAGMKYENWKLIKGNTEGWDGWYGPSGRNMSYDWKALFGSATAKAIKGIRKVPDKNKIKKIRTAAQIHCDKSISAGGPSESYLYDLSQDPCELQNLATDRPDIVNLIEERLEFYFNSMVKPRNEPTDPRSDPKFWGYAWVNWMDLI